MIYVCGAELVEEAKLRQTNSYAGSFNSKRQAPSPQFHPSSQRFDHRGLRICFADATIEHTLVVNSSMVNWVDGIVGKRVITRKRHRRSGRLVSIRQLTFKISSHWQGG
ncbi:hypothetical protein AB1N83_013301 [Pleurotus pulmonarius]